MTGMKRKVAAALAAIVVVAVAGAAVVYVMRHPPAQAPAPQPAQPDPAEEEVRSFVARFGEAFQNVPLYASAQAAARAVQDNYVPFVSEEILAAWEKEPEKAPGKSAGGPEPVRMAVLLADPDTDGSYLVQARVTEGAVEYPIAMRLRKQPGGWLITGFVKQMPL